MTERWYGAAGLRRRLPRPTSTRCTTHWVASCGRGRRAAALDAGALAGCVDADGAWPACGSPAARRSRRARCCSPPAASRATRELVKRFLGWDADRMLVRSNPGSTGDGFRLARAAGAAASRGLGHVLRAHGRVAAERASSPRATCRWRSTTPSGASSSTARAAATSTSRSGDEVANQMTLRQPGARGVLLCDERVRTERVIGPPYPHGQVIDRFEHARRWARTSRRRDTVEELVARVAEWGVDAAGLKRHAGALRARRRAGRADPARRCRCARRRSGRSSSSRRSRSRSAACASTRGAGCSTATARAVPGLYCAGGDAGGLQGPRYVAGLMLGLVFGPRAVEAVVMDKEESEHGS